MMDVIIFGIGFILVTLVMELGPALVLGSIAMLGLNFLPLPLPKGAEKNARAVQRTLWAVLVLVSYSILHRQQDLETFQGMISMTAPEIMRPVVFIVTTLMLSKLLVGLIWPRGSLKVTNGELWSGMALTVLACRLVLVLS